MIRFGLLFLLVLFVRVTVLAQPSATPTPTPRPGSRQSAVPAVVRDNASYDRLRSVEMMTENSQTANHPLLDSKKGIYRRPSKDETEVLAVAEPLLTTFASFLGSSNTGIVKLNADSECVSTTEVIVATEKCAVFRMPGAGAAFSFRTESYRLPRLADLILFNGTFRSDAVLQHVAMVELGDIPIGDIHLGSGGIKYLVDLKPARDGDEFLKYDAELGKGVTANGFLYRKGHHVKPNTTYALRSVAYRGKYIRSVDGIRYDELEFDKRRDVIVAFRAVDKDDAGNVTIVWKRLKDAESPRLKIKA